MTDGTSAKRKLSRVSTDRLREHIEGFAELTEPGPGVTRLAYTELEREAHARFAAHMSELGLRVRTDAVGNTIAELAASDGVGRSAVGTGSHLDSVPEGGRFDGIAGVAAAMELATLAVASSEPRRRPWRFVAFAGEEGARFGRACNGSRAIAGGSDLAALERLVDVDGVSMADAMRSVGLVPEQLDACRWHPDDWHAFVELHVEQGNVLETGGMPVGIVERISGSIRLAVEVTGVASHSGGTPMALRKDALTAAAACALEGERIALDPANDGQRVTVGRFETHPGSITTIPGDVVFTVDIRDFDRARQRATATRLVDAFRSIARERGVGLAVDELADTSPVELSSAVAEVVTSAAHELGVDALTLGSGASHDAQYVSGVTPTGMVFVPSRDGLSHVPEEWTDWEQLATGVRTLFAAFTRLDRVDLLEGGAPDRVEPLDRPADASAARA